VPAEGVFFQTDLSLKELGDPIQIRKIESAVAGYMFDRAAPNDDFLITR